MVNLRPAWATRDKEVEEEEEEEVDASEKYQKVI